MTELGVLLLFLLSILSIFLVPANHRSVGVVAMFFVFVGAHTSSRSSIQFLLSYPVLIMMRIIFT